METGSLASRLVVTPNSTIETLVQGKGPSLVVLPSYGRDGGRDFDEFSMLVERAGMCVLRPQPRGIGRSIGSMQASFEEMTNDIAEVIRKLGSGRAVVLGHAFGNLVARLLAHSHGDLIEGTILAAASTEGASAETNQTPFIAGDPSRLENERLEALRRGFFAPGHDARPWLEGWYPDTLKMQKDALTAVGKPFFSKAGIAPILQIIAESDPFNPYATWRTLREECGNRVTARIVADASHALFPEQTPRVAEIVIQWMNGLRGLREEPVA